MIFIKLPRGASEMPDDRDAVYLTIDLWNDYSFVTMFFIEYRDSEGQLHKVGQTKIGRIGQNASQPTFEMLPERFSSLSADFFSLGQDVEYYKSAASLPGEKGEEVLLSLGDLVVNYSALEEIRDEEVLKTSLLRNVSLSSLRSQFRRVLTKRIDLAPYKFSFDLPGRDGFDRLSLSFDVEPKSLPSSNIHAIIGQNGAGKTTILNSMVDLLTRRAADGSSNIREGTKADSNDAEFSSLVSFSFSAFDPFIPPAEQPDPARGMRYNYIGLKDPEDPGRLRTLQELRHECSRALSVCLSNDQKRVRWRNAVSSLNSDQIFKSFNLLSLADDFDRLSRGNDGIDLLKFEEISTALQKGMSSGHALVFITVTKLVAIVEEKTLVLMDEPESHLHPPLISAFIRVLSDLLTERNGLAIIATHSPVVLQEIPRSCVWKVRRVDRSVVTSRPAIETFGESIGLLTSEVFGLEVSRSGFHALLKSAATSADSYDQIIQQYGNQIGFEGRAILAAMLNARAVDGDYR